MTRNGLKQGTLGSGSKIYQLISQILTFLVTNGLSPPARHKASRLQRPFRRLGVPRQDKRILIRMSMQQARAQPSLGPATKWIARSCRLSSIKTWTGMRKRCTLARRRQISVASEVQGRVRVLVYYTSTTYPRFTNRRYAGDARDGIAVPGPRNQQSVALVIEASWRFAAGSF